MANLACGRRPTLLQQLSGHAQNPLNSLLLTLRIIFFLVALFTASLTICCTGIAPPFTWIGGTLGFVPLPWLYWPLLAIMLIAYAALTHRVKIWFVHRWDM